MSTGKKTFVILTGLLCLTLFFGLALEVAGAGHVTTVVSFNPSWGEFPEGVAVDKTGNIFVGLGPPGGGFGQIRKITPGGDQSTIAQLPSAPAGLAVDAPGNLFYGRFTPDPGTRGVYRLNVDGSSERLPGSGNIVLPNGLAFDKVGNLYVTDSIPGIIWRIPPGGAAELWFYDPLLEGCGLGADQGLPPVGANGIVFWHNALYVASTEQGLIVRVPLLPDGSAGAPAIIAGEPDCDAELTDLDSVDGIAMDVYGNIFAMLVIQNKLVRLDRATGQITELASAADGLHNPASLAFGTGMGDRQRIFFTNFALIPPPPASSLGPAVLSYDAGVPGLPLP
jgi:sugar lactone lactonase YvrE